MRVARQASAEACECGRPADIFDYSPNYFVELRGFVLVGFLRQDNTKICSIYLGEPHEVYIDTESKTVFTVKPIPKSCRNESATTHRRDIGEQPALRSDYRHTAFRQWLLQQLSHSAALRSELALRSRLALSSPNPSSNPSSPDQVATAALHVCLLCWRTIRTFRSCGMYVFPHTAGIASSSLYPPSPCPRSFIDSAPDRSASGTLSSTTSSHLTHSRPN